MRCVLMVASCGKVMKSLQLKLRDWSLSNACTTERHIPHVCTEHVHILSLN